MVLILRSVTRIQYGDKNKFILWPQKPQSCILI